jgi:hypothetical protein
MSVAVWVDAFSSTDHDIRAQLYNSDGTRKGSEIVVDNTTIDSGEPAVSMDSRGDFVVTWTDFKPGGNSDVEARVYNSNTSPVTGIVAVANTANPEHAPDVAMDANGNFVVSYTYDFSPSDQDIYAHRYNFNAQLQQSIAVATTTQNESRSSVAMAPDGRFDIAYQYQFSSSDDDIYLNRYSSGGSNLLGHLAVATSTDREQAPSVSMDNSAHAVVAYQRLVGGDWDIKARRVSDIVGGELNIRNTLADEFNPSVALNRTDGSFVVAYDSWTSGTGNHVLVSEVSPSNVVSSPIDLGGFRSDPAISIDGNGVYMLTYTTNDSGDLNIRGRFGHR